jgi:hypothetical protein
MPMRPQMYLDGNVEEGGKKPNLRGDLVSAVRAVFSAADADEVLSLLSRVESDRVAVAILVGATLGRPDVDKVRHGVADSFVDYRDVLMNEYDKRIDYKAALQRLGLERPYPI